MSRQKYINSAYIIYLRRTKGVERKDLIPVTGRSLASISAWENRVRSPSEKDVKKMADYFGVPVDGFYDPNALPSAAPTLEPARPEDALNILVSKMISCERTVTESMERQEKQLGEILQALRVRSPYPAEKKKKPDPGVPVSRLPARDDM